MIKLGVVLNIGLLAFYAHAGTHTVLALMHAVVAVVCSFVLNEESGK